MTRLTFGCDGGGAPRTSSAASTFTATGRPSSSAPSSTGPRRPLERRSPCGLDAFDEFGSVGSDGRPTLRSGSGLGDGLECFSVDPDSESERSATSDWGRFRADAKARRFCIA